MEKYEMYEFITEDFERKMVNDNTIGMIVEYSSKYSIDDWDGCGISLLEIVCEYIGDTIKNKIVSNKLFDDLLYLLEITICDSDNSTLVNTNSECSGLDYLISSIIDDGDDTKIKNSRFLPFIKLYVEKLKDYKLLNEYKNMDTEFELDNILEIFNTNQIH